MATVGLSEQITRQMIRDKSMVPVVYGAQMLPNAPTIAQNDSGLDVINLWEQPSIVPAPHPHPRIDFILDQLTNHDTKDKAWLVNWLAQKVQHPGANMKVAVVFHNNPASGKGSLFKIIAQILGPKNCTEISQKNLENKFNNRWVDKLFILADEVVSMEDFKNLSDTLKVLIGGYDLEQEAKGVDQRMVKNRIAWMFASNNKTTPVLVETEDRRYTVLSNYTPLTSEYKAMIKGCWKQVDGPTDSFSQEIAGFAHRLHNHEVDLPLATTPLVNAARKHIQTASVPTYEAFVSAVNKSGFDFLMGRYGKNLMLTKAEWDYADKGVALDAVYAVYQEFCRKGLGQKPFGCPRLRTALQNFPTPWPEGEVAGLVTLDVPRSPL